MRALLAAAMLLASPLAAYAKLPPPTPEAQAKSEEAKLKAAEASRKEAELLGRYQDRAAANWAENAKARGVPFEPTPVGGTKAVLPAGGTVATVDKTVPTPAQAAATSTRANAQPAQAGGLPKDGEGGAGAPVVVRR